MKMTGTDGNILLKALVINTTCGNDLFMKQIQRLAKGIDKKVANSILIKLNQIGTLSRDHRCNKNGR